MSHCAYNGIDARLIETRGRTPRLPKAVKSKSKALPTREIRRNAKPFAMGVSKEEFDNLRPSQKEFLTRWNKPEKR